jgi:hypothetical protein
MRIIPLVGLAIVIAGCAKTPPPPPIAPQVLEVRKIWDEAPHNAFTDLIRFRDRWYCTFRESSAHVPGTDGKIRVISSADGEKWESAALLEESGVDLRDPKLSIMPDGRMMLLIGSSIYAGKNGEPNRKLESFRTRVAFSNDGVAWTTPTPVSIEKGNWLWRVTWNGKTGYGVSYSGERESRFIKLWKTSDGVDYQLIMMVQSPPGCYPNETTLRFDGEKMIALVRSEDSDRYAWIATAMPPYESWVWQECDSRAQGPNFIVLPDKRMIYAGRDHLGQSRTVIGEIKDNNLVRSATLPSGGDTSYPGLALAPDGKVWMCYYSSHEGKTAIYLAKIAVTQTGQTDH